MVVKAKSTEKEDDIDKIENTPYNFTYEESDPDTILLEHPKFNTDDPDIINPTPLKTIDQIILLCFCLNINNRNARDGLVSEQLKPYILRVLLHPSNWMVNSLALYLRSLNEFENYRTQERSLLQIQAIIDQHINHITLTQDAEAVKNAEPANHRLLYIHEIPYPPRWLLIKALAKRYLSCGLSESAYQLYEQIKLYNKMIICLMRSGHRSRAKDLVFL